METKSLILGDRHTPFGAAVAYVVKCMQIDLDNLKKWGDNRNIVIGYTESLIATLVAAGEIATKEEEAVNHYENEYE